MSTQYYYVTRSPGQGFVATLTLAQIEAGLANGELQESFSATESDGRSFAQFQRSNYGGEWRTLADLLAEHAQNVSYSAQPVLSVRLISCPACGRQISTEAEACPQCGHPNRAAPREPEGPRCYACRAAATTRCQSCGVLSCAQHLQSIYVSHGHGGAYELRCDSCYSSAEAWKVFGWVVAGIAIVVVLMVWASMAHR
jgi:hypothetical protein